MSNIIDYVIEYGDKTFEEFEFNEVDSLIFSQLMYLKFEKCSQLFLASHTLQDLYSKEYCDKIINGTRASDKNRRLLNIISEKARFNKIRISNFINVSDKDSQKQFSAITFHLSNNLHYIAFRGTDSSFIGWKEDFNLSFSETVPSQIAAVDYFNQISQSNNGYFILGGHSKGGNLAVYAGAMCCEDSKNNVIAIYNHDGPGFLTDFYNSEAFKSVHKRIHKTIPQSAIVGLLLEEHGDYSIIASDAIAVMQHDPFKWKIQNGNFIFLEKVGMLSEYTNRTINTWLNSANKETRKIFIDTLYNIITETEASTFPELISDLRNIKPIIMGIKSVDPEIRQLIYETLKALVISATYEMRTLIHEKINK